MTERDRLGQYRIAEHVSRDARGDVFLADPDGPDAFLGKVTLKTMRLAAFSSERDREAMFRNAALYATLSHSALLRLYERFSEHDELVVVLEYVPGVSLAEIVSESASLGMRLPDGFAFFVGLRLFGALAAAHNARDPIDGSLTQNVHGDVRPEFVLLPQDGFIRLTDFPATRTLLTFRGLGADRRLPASRHLAPEQVTHGTVTARSDVYSAALVVWELLAGRAAIDATASGASLARNMSAPQLPRLLSLRPDLPEPLLAALTRALAVNPDQRTIAAADLLTVLSDLVPRDHPEQVVSGVLSALGATAAEGQSGKGPRTIEYCEVTTSKTLEPATVAAMSRGSKPRALTSLFDEPDDTGPSGAIAAPPSVQNVTADDTQPIGLFAWGQKTLSQGGTASFTQVIAAPAAAPTLERGITAANPKSVGAQKAASPHNAGRYREVPASSPEAPRPPRLTHATPAASPGTPPGPPVRPLGPIIPRESEPPFDVPTAERPGVVGAGVAVVATGHTAARPAIQRPAPMAERPSVPDVRAHARPVQSARVRTTPMPLPRWPLNPESLTPPTLSTAPPAAPSLLDPSGDISLSTGLSDPPHQLPTAVTVAAPPLKLSESLPSHPVPRALPPTTPVANGPPSSHPGLPRLSLRPSSADGGTQTRTAVLAATPPLVRSNSVAPPGAPAHQAQRAGTPSSMAVPTVARPPVVVIDASRSKQSAVESGRRVALIVALVLVASLAGTVVVFRARIVSALSTKTMNASSVYPASTLSSMLVPTGRPLANATASLPVVASASVAPSASAPLAAVSATPAPELGATYPSVLPTRVASVAVRAIAIPAPPTPSVTEDGAPLDATHGRVSTALSAKGRRVWIDGRLMGETPERFVVHCGSRSVQVGSHGTLQPIDVPCGGEVNVR